jgi:hypothetical protein
MYERMPQEPDPIDDAPREDEEADAACAQDERETVFVWPEGGD